MRMHFVCVATLAAGLALFADQAHAGTITLTVGEPSFPGEVTIELTSGHPGGFLTTMTVVPVPGIDTAAEKAAAIARVLNEQNGIAATVTGTSSVVIPDVFKSGAPLTDLFIDGDTTGESNQISVSIDSGDEVAFFAIPNPNTSMVPPAGLSFATTFVNVPGLAATVGAFVQSDGTRTVGDLQNTSLFSLGLQSLNFNSTFIDPATGLLVLKTPFFVENSDPIVQVNFDGNTSQYLGTFGIEVQSAVPEPQPKYAGYRFAGACAPALPKGRPLSPTLRPNALTLAPGLRPVHR